MSLKENALILNLKISQWAGRKFDKRATSTVEATHATQARVGNFNKRLLPGAVELENVATQAGSLRKFWAESTLPWAADGSRIISSQHYLEFMNEFRKRKIAFDSAVAEFLAKYPTLQAEAKAKLGDLFSIAEYPSVENLARKFSCDISVFPIPGVEDFRVNLAEAERAEFMATLKRAESEAMADCWNRLHEVVKTAAERLNQPDAVFRESLLENVNALCAILPKLNIMADPKLEAMRSEVEAAVNRIDVKTIRKSTDDRQNSARELNSILNRMADVMGSQGGLS